MFSGIVEKTFATIAFVQCTILYRDMYSQQKAKGMSLTKYLPIT
jgi:hypothetical protein